MKNGNKGRRWIWGVKLCERFVTQKGRDGLNTLVLESPPHHDLDNVDYRVVVGDDIRPDGKPRPPAIPTTPFTVIHTNCQWSWVRIYQTAPVSLCYFNS